MTRAMMIDSYVPMSFWPETVSTATYLLNRLPSKVLNYKTPIQTLSTQHDLPSIYTLPPRVFGCTVFLYTPRHERTKLDPCSKKCVFVRYATTQKGYRCFNRRTHHIHITMDCTFLETEYYYLPPSRLQGDTSCDGTLDWLVPQQTCPVTIPTRQVDDADYAIALASVPPGVTVSPDDSPSVNAPQQVNCLDMNNEQSNTLGTHGG